MKNILTVLCFIFVFSFAQAQEVSEDTLKLARHSVFVELGGNAGLYSLNYDRLLHRGKWFHTSARAGIYYNWWAGGRLGIPLEVNGLFGRKKHFLEMGVSLVYNHGLDPIVHKADPAVPTSEDIYANFSNLLAIGRLGYRFQKPQGGFFFRAAYTPYTTIWSGIPDTKRGLFSVRWYWFGISVGRSF